MIKEEKFYDLSNSEMENINGGGWGKVIGIALSFAEEIYDFGRGFVKGLRSKK